MLLSTLLFRDGLATLQHSTTVMCSLGCLELLVLLCHYRDMARAPHNPPVVYGCHIRRVRAGSLLAKINAVFLIQVARLSIKRVPVIRIGHTQPNVFKTHVDEYRFGVTKDE